jgi:hypothetical protein
LFFNSLLINGFSDFTSFKSLELEALSTSKIPRILRLCITCNKIEDEEHFILECTINSKLRTDLFAILANENPNFIQVF